MESESLLTIEQAQLGSAIFIALFGIFVELHYVSKYTIIMNIIGIFLIVASVPIWSYSFLLAAGFFVIGLLVMAKDVKTQAKKTEIAFLLGSKTLGSVGIFTGIIGIGWIDKFKPLLDYLVEGSNYDSNSLELHVFVFFLVLSSVHVIGLIVWGIKKFKT